MLSHWAKGVLWELLKLRPQKYVTNILHTVRSGMLICACYAQTKIDMWWWRLSLVNTWERQYLSLKFQLTVCLLVSLSVRIVKSTIFQETHLQLSGLVNVRLKAVGTMDFILAHLRNVMSFCFCRPCFSLTSYFPSGVRHLLLISYHMTTIRQSEQSSLLETVRAEEYHNHFKTFLMVKAL